MSIPRAAISVAIRTLVIHDLKFLSALCLLFWVLFPWIASAFMFSCASCLTTLSAPCFVRVKTSTCSIFLFHKIVTSNDILSDFFTKNTAWLTVSAVEETGVTSILIGWVRISSARWEISFGIVAEKKSVCLFFGNSANIFLTSWINHISSIRSASSRVNISTWERSINHWFMRSRSLHGVATSISIHFCSCLTCDHWDTHPKITVCLRPRPFP